MKISLEEFAGKIDHTLLKPTATEDQIKKICDDAVKHKFASVCVNPKWVAAAADLLQGQDVMLCCVAGFPLGANTRNIKQAEAREAVLGGADEIDMVADLSCIIQGNRKGLIDDISAVLTACRTVRPAAALKVIIESAALTDEQIVFVSGVCSQLGVDFVKTSTGFHPQGGATKQAVSLIKANCGKCKVKAAGGIKTLDQAFEMIRAGADRLGCSGSVSLVESFKMAGNAG